MAKSEFRKYVDQTQELPADVVLGNIVWHTVVDGAYSLARIEELFVKLDLDPAFIPARTTAFNAFEKACTKALQAAKPYPLDSARSQRVGEIMAIREVSRTHEIVVRHVIREVRDSNEKKLRHEAVAELTFFRQTPGSNGLIDHSATPKRKVAFFPVLMDGEEPHVNAVIDRWNQEFDRLYNYVDGDKVRAVVRNYLGFLNAVMMKQGVYFVHKNREDELERLQTFVHSLVNEMSSSEDSGCRLELMPIPEIKRLRESVIEAFQDEAVKELSEVVAAIQKVRSSRETITPQAFAKLSDQYQTTMRKASEYARTLRCTQDRTAGAAETALESLNALRGDMVKQMEA